MRVAQELAGEIGMKRTCQVLNVPRSRMYRQSKAQVKGGSKHWRGLSEEERTKVRETLNSERFMDRSPRQVYAALLDEEQYLCHWRTMYRVLAAHDEVRERRAVRRHPVYQRPELLATAPNQVWSWDITYLRGPAKWTHYPLYTVLDVYSRYVVGWMIAEEESSELARQLMAVTCTRQGIQPDQLTLHADNGAPMKGKTLAQLLIDLGIAKSHSRPHTSNDNPFSEAQFKTMKYRPDYPDRFEGIEAGRTWGASFFQWYNNEHYHSGLNLLTPTSVHYGTATMVQQQRQSVMLNAFAAHPKRFSKGVPVVKGAPAAVYINPPKNTESLQ